MIVYLLNLMFARHFVIHVWKEYATMKLIHACVKCLENAMPYSPDLAASDFHLFSGIKQDLGGQQFATEDKLHAAVAKTLPEK